MNRITGLLSLFTLSVLLLLSSCRIRENELGILNDTSWNCGDSAVNFYSGNMADGNFASDSGSFEVSYDGKILRVRCIRGSWTEEIGTSCDYECTVSGQKMTTKPVDGAKYNALFTSGEREWNKVN